MEGMNELNIEAVDEVGDEIQKHDDEIGCSAFHLFSEDTTQRDLTGLLQLPDIDDTSMAHVFAYVEHYQEDLYWSLASDSFFVFGGSMYLLLSVWNYVGGIPDILNMSLSVLAPLVYLINGVVDIAWASAVRRRSKVLSSMQKFWEESVSSDESVAASIIEDSNPTTTGTETTSSTRTDGPANEPHPPVAASFWKRFVNQFHRIRRHAAHRRTVYAALTFGAAALTAFVAVVVQYSGGSIAIANWFSVISVHLYFVSAVTSVTGKRTRPWLAHRSCLANHESLEDLGDLFFLVGSIVDVALRDSTFDDHAASWTVVSSSFWWLDACFYLLSDVTMAYKFSGHHRLPGSPDDASLTLV
jgi:hypothetical protein